MRKLIPMLAVAVLSSGVALLVQAAEVKTITGNGQCAKCELKETAKCQNTITVTENGKEVVYYLKQNEVSKKFHKNICQDPTKTVKATGDVKEEDGKLVMDPTKVEVVEE
ncbi:MAG: DUF6370 family protein [Isosphaeraceae bacterium]